MMAAICVGTRSSLPVLSSKATSFNVSSQTRYSAKIEDATSDAYDDLRIKLYVFRENPFP